MTIYNFELETEALERLPTIQCAVRLCEHVCSLILTHLYSNVLGGYPGLSREARDQQYCILLHLGTMQTFLPNQEGSVYPITVHSMYVEYPINKIQPTVMQSFTMDSLNQVSPSVLLKVVARWVHCCVTILLPHIRSMPSSRRQDCVETINYSVRKLTKILNEFLTDRRIAMRSFSKPFFYIQVKVEFADHKSDERCLP